MSKSQTAVLAAFNTAVVLTNISHSVARGTAGVARGTRDCGVGFMAGLRYAHATNKATGAAAKRVTVDALVAMSDAAAAAAAAPADTVFADAAAAAAPVAAAPSQSPRRKAPAAAPVAA